LGLLVCHLRQHHLRLHDQEKNVVPNLPIPNRPHPLRALRTQARMKTKAFRFITPSELAKVERTGTPAERVLAANIRALAHQLNMRELLLGKTREALTFAVEIVSPTDANTEVSATAIDAFVELAIELSDDKAVTVAFRQWAQAHRAASLAAEGGKPREYLVEVAREILHLPAKDGAARSLVKMDLERITKASEATIHNALLEPEEEAP